MDGNNFYISDFQKSKLMQEELSAKSLMHTGLIGMISAIGANTISKRPSPQLLKQLSTTSMIWRIMPRQLPSGEGSVPFQRTITRPLLLA